MNLIEEGKTQSEKNNQISVSLQNELDFFKKINPETTIFLRKKALAEKLLEINVEDLQNAPKQPWYNEYIALLSIRIENPALCSEGKKSVEDLLKWYQKNVGKDNRDLAVLGMLQFIEPTELDLPFNQHLWHKNFVEEVKNVFLKRFTNVNYSDDEISTYYLSRQLTWRHGKRKMRVVFLLHSHITCDKVLPVYEALKKREDTETFLVVHADVDLKHNEGAMGRPLGYFRKRYPNVTIYDANSLMDLKKLRPDYVFLTNPYEGKRPFKSFRCNDLIQFTKICHISYGASLAFTFVERLLDDYPHFYRTVSFLFCSSKTVKKLLTNRYSENVVNGYQHFEFLGYPVLSNYYKMKIEPSVQKRILWTPRWIYDERVGGSHFLEYKDKYVSLCEKYEEKIKLFIRPHMNTFRYLRKRGLMTREEIIEYKRNLRKNKIEINSTYADLGENIRNIDIFLSDYSSMLIVIFLTGRPIIYCEYPNAKPFPEYQEMFDAMYIAHTWEDVEHYIDDLIKGNDPLYEKRQAVAETIYETHKDATQKIVECLLKDFAENQIDM